MKEDFVGCETGLLGLSVSLSCLNAFERCDLPVRGPFRSIVLVCLILFLMRSF